MEIVQTYCCFACAVSASIRLPGKLQRRIALTHDTPLVSDPRILDCTNVLYERVEPKLGGIAWSRRLPNAGCTLPT